MKKTLSALVGTLFFSFTANATVVEIRTVMGDIQVNLFDEATPATVQNFLQYVNAGAYANNVVHRSAPGFVIQAGGFQYNGVFPPDAIAVGAPVTNEPELSNVRGTIAMAKLANDPNSATSQWFINLDDNSTNLDGTNGGFTAFGQVLGDGMDVVDAIADLPFFNAGGQITAIPLIDYSNADADAGTPVEEENIVIIQDIVVIDDATVTNPDIVPVENTIIDNSGGDNGGDQTPDPTPPATGGSSGGSMSFFAVFAGLGLAFMRRLRKS